MIFWEQLKQATAVVSVGLHRLAGDRDGGRLGVLMHHRVSPRTAGLPNPPYNVAPEVFRKQLLGLLSAGYRFARMSEVLEARRSGRALAPRSVLLTFDDAYASVYCHAFPIMRELGVPGIAFLSTSFLDSDEPFPFDPWSRAYRHRVPAEEYRPLGTQQCREMLASGLFEFGAHTHTHQDFRGRPDEFRADTAQSVDIVRNLFQLQEVPFAFPYGGTAQGHAGGELAKAAQEAGACCALTTDSELVDPLVDDPFNWGRFTVFSWETASTLSAKLAGWHAWARSLKKLVSSPVAGPSRGSDVTPATTSNIRGEVAQGSLT
jgi:peptidoglycan/xylan/chitin deacetylase (PgdA/CDA1 family)